MHRGMLMLILVALVAIISLSIVDHSESNVLGEVTASIQGRVFDETISTSDLIQSKEESVLTSDSAFSIIASVDSPRNAIRFPISIRLVHIDSYSAGIAFGEAYYAYDNNKNGVYDQGDGVWRTLPGFFDLAESDYKKTFVVHTEDIRLGDVVVRFVITAGKSSAETSLPFTVIAEEEDASRPNAATITGFQVGEPELACSCKSIKIVNSGKNPLDPGSTHTMGPKPKPQTYGTVPVDAFVTDPDENGFDTGDEFLIQNGFSIQAEVEYVQAQGPASCPEKQEIQETRYKDLNGDGDYKDPKEVSDVIAIVVRPNPLGGTIHSSMMSPRGGPGPNPGTSPFGGKTYKPDGYEEKVKKGKDKTPIVKNKQKITTVDLPGYNLPFPVPKSPVQEKRMVKFRFTIDGVKKCDKCFTLVQEYKLIKRQVGLIPQTLQNKITEVKC